MTRRSRHPRRNADGWIRCHTCGGYSPPELMPRNSCSADGYTSQCRPCRQPTYTRWYTKLATDEARYQTFLTRQRERNKARRDHALRSRRARIGWALDVLFTHGYSQSRIAREANVAADSIYNWKHGKTPWPGTLDRVERLAASLIWTGTGDD